MERTGYQWDDVSVDEISVDDLDNDSFDIFRREAIKNGRVTKGDLRHHRITGRQKTMRFNSTQQESEGINVFARRA